MHTRNIASRVTMAVALAIAGSTQALAAWNENFDSYATNSTIIGQGGWQGWDQNPLADATVVNTVAVSAPNSLRITGTSDAVHTFSGYTSGKWVFRAMHYVSSTSVGDNYFILLNKYVDGTHQNPDWSVQLRARASDKTMLSIEGNKTLPLVVDAWAEIRCEIDLDTNSVTIFYNGQLLATTPWFGTQAAIEAVDLYSDNVNSLAYFDDLSLTPLSSTERLAPVAQTVNLGKISSGNLASLAADDNNPEVICKFFVPNLASPFVSTILTFNTTKASPTAMSFEVKAKWNNAGAYQISLLQHNYSTNADDTTMAYTNLGGTYTVFTGTAAGTLTNYVSGGNTSARILVKQTGPSTALLPCVSFEYANQIVTG